MPRSPRSARSQRQTPADSLRRPPVPVWAALFALAGVLLAVTSMRHKSVTYDELSHLTAGYSYWQTGDFRMTPDHPPLAELLAAAPLLAMDLRFPTVESPFWKRGFVWGLGREFLNRPNDVDRMLFRARLPIVALWFAGGVLAWTWSRRLFGAPGATVTAALYFLSPNLIAHARLVTTDIAAGVFFLATLFTACALTQRINVPRLLAGSIALGGLFLSKFSAPLILPVLALLALARVLSRRSLPLNLICSGEMRTPLQRLVSLGLVSAWLTATTVLIIWATFGFRYPASPGMPPDSTAHFIKPPRVFETAPPLTDQKTQSLIDQYGRTDISVWQQLVHPSPRIGRCILWARDHRLLPEAYLYGLAFTVRSTASRWSFLLGKAKETGWWYYFPVALAVKTPLATIGVVIMALFLAARRSFRPSRDPFVNVSAASMALFIGLYLFTAMTGNINLGLRHLIPAQMLLFVLCGAAASLVSPDRRWTRPTLHALIACLAGASLAAWPNYLPFFNSFVGGPKNGWKYLADSNVDWGQDLPALARYLREHNEKDVKLAYFGVGRPEYYGIQASYFPVPYEACVLDGGPPGPIARFTPGTYALSATALQGWNLPYEFRPWTQSLDTLERRLAARFQHLADNGPIPTDPATKRHFDLWRQLQYARLLHALRQRRPDDQVGHSILIYRLDPQDLNEIFPPPVRPPPNDPPQSRIPPNFQTFQHQSTRPVEYNGV